MKYRYAYAAFEGKLKRMYEISSDETSTLFMVSGYMNIDVNTYFINDAYERKSHTFFGGYSGTKFVYKLFATSKRELLKCITSLPAEALDCVDIMKEKKPEYFV